MRRVKSRALVFSFALALVVGQNGVAGAAPMGTAFTYQGRLLDGAGVADGLYDFQFKVYNAPIFGKQQGRTVLTTDVDVVEGYFAVELDFGSSVFDGDARWLQVGVRPGNSIAAFTNLSPLQELTPAPYAIYAKTAGTSLNGGDGPTVGFPRPNYDSGWVELPWGGEVELSHGLGGDPENYLVDLQFYYPIGPEIDWGIHNRGIGGDTHPTDYRYMSRGAYYEKLNADSITVSSCDKTTYFTPKVRVRIWVYE